MISRAIKEITKAKASNGLVVTDLWVSVNIPDPWALWKCLNLIRFRENWLE